MQKSFLYNSVRVRHVPWHGQDTHPETGIALYVSSGEGGVIGVQVFPNGTKHQINAVGTKFGHCYSHGKAEYLQFKDAWGKHKHVLASRAVFMAWYGKPIPAGMTIDHIDGCSTNNDYRNLRCVSGAINSRDGGFLRKLKKAGFEPTTIQRAILLRYFTRMAKYKAEHTPAEYKNLSREALQEILFNN